jgi:uncharacterized membrane protein YozB (DUF420 family)
VVPLTRSGSSPTDLWEAFTLVLAYSLLFAGWVIAMSGKRRRHDHMNAMSFWAHVAAALAIAFIFPYATLITGFASPWYEQSGATADAAGILSIAGVVLILVLIRNLGSFRPRRIRRHLATVPMSIRHR